MSPRAALDYNRLGLMIILSVVFYNEILVYFNTFRSWPEVEQQRVFKILFVADPVIFYLESTIFKLKVRFCQKILMPL